MNEKEIIKLREYYLQICKDAQIDNESFDFEQELTDTTLTYQENLNLLNEKLEGIIPNDHTLEELKELEKNDLNSYKNGEREQREKLREELGMFKEQANVLVIGKKRSGKTCLAFAFLEQFGKYDRKMYVYKFPRPELLEELPFEVNNLTNLKQINNLKNAVVFIDESEKIFPILEKTVNQQLRNILSLSGQNNICFIFVCHNSYFINRSLFSFIDIKVIKEVNESHWFLERPHMAKLYENYPVLGVEKFFIDSDYYRGMETFEKPEWFSDKLSYGYSNFTKDDFFKKFAN